MMTMNKACCVMNFKNITLYSIIDITQNVLVYEFFRKIADLSTKSYIVLNMGFFVENPHKRKDFQV